MDFDTMIKGLIQLKMKGSETLEQKAEWLDKFLLKKYPNNEAKRIELAKYAGIAAATKYDGYIECTNCQKTLDKGTERCPKCGKYTEESQEDFEKHLEDLATLADNEEEMKYQQ